MTETAVAAPAPEPVKAKTPKKKGAKATGAAKSKPTHPPTAQMVNAAVKTLKERGGSSLQAIKKYISATYGVDAEKLAPFIRKYIKGAVASGQLVQTKGTGAAGSFKLPGGAAAKEEGEKKKTKASKPKKPAAAKKEAVEKKPKKAAPTKAKKVKKPPTTPKAPKAKKAAKSPAKPKKPAAPKKATKKPAKKTSPKKK